MYHTCTQWNSVNFSHMLIWGQSPKSLLCTSVSYPSAYMIIWFCVQGQTLFLPCIICDPSDGVHYILCFKSSRDQSRYLHVCSYTMEVSVYWVYIVIWGAVMPMWYHLIVFVHNKRHKNLKGNRSNPQLQAGVRSPRPLLLPFYTACRKWSVSASPLSRKGISAMPQYPHSEISSAMCLTQMLTFHWITVSLHRHLLHIT